MGIFNLLYHMHVPVKQKFIVLSTFEKQMFRKARYIYIDVYIDIFETN